MFELKSSKKKKTTTTTRSQPLVIRSGGPSGGETYDDTEIKLMISENTEKANSNELIANGNQVSNSFDLSYFKFTKENITYADTNANTEYQLTTYDNIVIYNEAMDVVPDTDGFIKLKKAGLYFLDFDLAMSKAKDSYQSGYIHINAYHEDHSLIGRLDIDRAGVEDYNFNAIYIMNNEDAGVETYYNDNTFIIETTEDNTCVKLVYSMYFDVDVNFRILNANIRKYSKQDIYIENNKLTADTHGVLINDISDKIETNRLNINATSESLNFDKSYCKINSYYRFIDLVNNDAVTYEAFSELIEKSNDNIDRYGSYYARILKKGTYIIKFRFEYHVNDDRFFGANLKILGKLKSDSSVTAEFYSKYFSYSSSESGNKIIDIEQTITTEYDDFLIYLNVASIENYDDSIRVYIEQTDIVIIEKSEVSKKIEDNKNQITILSDLMLKKKDFQIAEINIKRTDDEFYECVDDTIETNMFTIADTIGFKCGINTDINNENYNKDIWFSDMTPENSFCFNYSKVDIRITGTYTIKADATAQNALVAFALGNPDVGFIENMYDTINTFTADTTDPYTYNVDVVLKDLDIIEMNTIVLTARNSESGNISIISDLRIQVLRMFA